MKQEIIHSAPPELRETVEYIFHMNKTAGNQLTRITMSILEDEFAETEFFSTEIHTLANSLLTDIQKRANGNGVDPNAIWYKAHTLAVRALEELASRFA